VENSLQILNKTKKFTLACFVECEQCVMHCQNLSRAFVAVNLFGTVSYLCGRLRPKITQNNKRRCLYLIYFSLVLYLRELKNSLNLLFVTVQI
jgi:hypothetical protein